MVHIWCLVLEMWYKPTVRLKSWALSTVFLNVPKSLLIDVPQHIYHTYVCVYKQWYHASGETCITSNTFPLCTKLKETSTKVLLEDKLSSKP